MQLGRVRARLRRLSAPEDRSFGAADRHSEAVILLQLIPDQQRQRARHGRRGGGGRRAEAVQEQRVLFDGSAGGGSGPEKGKEKEWGDAVGSEHHGPCKRDMPCCAAAAPWAAIAASRPPRCCTNRNRSRACW